MRGSLPRRPVTWRAIVRVAGSRGLRPVGPWRGGMVVLARHTQRFGANSHSAGGLYRDGLLSVGKGMAYRQQCDKGRIEVHDVRIKTVD